MREYTFDAMRRHHSINWPGECVESLSRIRVVAALLFREYFGHPATFIWYKDGFMAGAKDDQGNDILVEQTNRTPIPRTRALWKFPSTPRSQPNPFYAALAKEA